MTMKELRMDTSLRKRFNTAGPCDPNRHFMLPAAERLPDIGRLIEDASYFTLFGPARPGKTPRYGPAWTEYSPKGAALHCTAPWKGSGE
jgi:hypothetical protein